MITLSDSKYFNTLPKTVQDGILQSGMAFESEGELMTFASGYEPGGLPLEQGGSFYNTAAKLSSL